MLISAGTALSNCHKWSCAAWGKGYCGTFVLSGPSSFGQKTPDVCASSGIRDSNKWRSDARRWYADRGSVEPVDMWHLPKAKRSQPNSKERATVASVSVAGRRGGGGGVYN